MKRIDLKGQTFGRLTVLESAGQDKSKRLMWKCKCSCEKKTELIIQSCFLRDGSRVCCGCTRNGIDYGNSVKDLTGMIFGKLTVLKYLGSCNHNKAKWLCKCSCPLDKEVEVISSNLIRGNTTSCGCVRLEKSVKASTSHGLTGTGEYHSWWAMMSRCYNEKNNRYKYYGARGIKVCDRWKNSKELFFEDMKMKPSPKHSIDRRNIDGDYCLENCYWATPEEQANNKSSNVYIFYKDKRYSPKEIEQEFGTNADLVRARLKHGFSPEEIIFGKVKR